MVDDIGVQYFNKKDADHSCWPLKQLNQGKLPCENRLDRIKIHRNWSRLELKNRTSSIISRRVCKKVLKEYQHKAPTKPFDAPIKYHKPELGQKVWYERVDESTSLSPTQIKIIQEVCGKFLLYTSWAIDNTTCMHWMSYV